MDLLCSALFHAPTTASVAQLVELPPCKRTVKGSSPFASSTPFKKWGFRPSKSTFLQKFIRAEAMRLHGEIPKWPTGMDCKSIGSAFRGSNPLLPTRTHRVAHFCVSHKCVAHARVFHNNVTCLGGCSSMVEPQPSKLVTRVRLPSPARPVEQNPIG